MLIRQEMGNDYVNIHALVKKAFETARVSDGKEQDYVTALRHGTGYIPELALVGEEGGRLIAHIMLTELAIADTKKPLRCLLLAPVSVIEECRGKSIGSALIRDSMARAAALGYDAVFVVGDPAYYQRFGFRQTTVYGIAYQPEIPAEYVMVCELKPGVLKGAGGLVDLHVEAASV